MSNFTCEKCGTAIIDTPSRGYVTGCEHYPLEKITGVSSTITKNDIGKNQLVFGIQKLKGGAEVYINSNEEKCKCGATIFWAIMHGPKNDLKKRGIMPVCWDGDGWISHLANCPNAK